MPKPFELTFASPSKPFKLEADLPLDDPSILLTGGCHVDHEGFDLNEIEQAYYKQNGFSFSQDSTWYKDGDGDRGTNAILQPWAKQTTPIDFDNFVLDHSHFVFKFPIVGQAAIQILDHTKQRPELLRLLSTRFKCGLDICIDYIGSERVEPIVHIEWDFNSFEQMVDQAEFVKHRLEDPNWQSYLHLILEYNSRARAKKLDAFEQADRRALLFFQKKSYILIPTL